MVTDESAKWAEDQVRVHPLQFVMPFDGVNWLRIWLAESIN